MDDYQKTLTTIIQKYMVILGPYLTLKQVREIKGITVDDSGQVTAVPGDNKIISQQFVERFMKISEPIGKRQLKPLIDQFLIGQNPAAQPVVNTTTPVQNQNQNQNQETTNHDAAAK